MTEKTVSEKCKRSVFCVCHVYAQDNVTQIYTNLQKHVGPHAMRELLNTQYQHNLWEQLDTVAHLLSPKYFT